MKHKDQEYLAEQIRSQYTEPQHTELDALKALDRKVKRPAHLFTGTFGTLSALVLGVGMSLLMSDFGALLGLLDFPAGLAAGVAGILLLVGTYPLYCRTLKQERARVAPEILRLSDELMK